MPEYSVLLIDMAARQQNSYHNPDWSKTTLRVRAVSPSHAMRKAEQKLNRTIHNDYQAKSARRATHDREYWHKIWKKAYDNMPTRIYVAKSVLWDPLPPGETPLPEFIKQNAKGLMQQHTDGVIYKKRVVRQAHKMGAQNALTKLLGYAKAGRPGSMAHSNVFQAMCNGSRPKTAERREMLLKLTGPNGASIAAEILGRPFRPLKIKG